MLRHRTLSGVVWNFVQTLSQRGISVLVTMVLARFLAPKEFGLLAMMSVFLTIANSLMDSGFREALIQKGDVEDADFETAFWANLFFGLFAYLLLFLTAPFVADFYNELQLTMLLRIAGVAIIANSLQGANLAYLTRQLDFRTQLLATIPASFFSAGIAVSLAYFGAGVWALVAQSLSAAIVSTVLLLRIPTWRLEWTFNRRSFVAMFGFGKNLFAASFLEIVFSNSYVIVIGRMFSASVAGYYFFAQRIRDLVLFQLVSSVQAVTFPALVSLQDDDTRLKAGYRKLVKVTTFLLFPVLLFLSVLSKPFFLTFFGAEWLPAADYLSLVCLAGVFYPLHALNLNILKVKGRSDFFLKIELIKKVLHVLVLTASLPFGIIGILVGQIAVSVISYLPNSFYSSKLIGYPIREQILDFLPPLALAGGIASFVMVLVDIITISPSLELFGGGFLAVLTYAILAGVFKFEALSVAKDLVRRKQPKAQEFA